MALRTAVLRVGAVAVGVAVALGASVAAAEAPRMGKEELRGLLGREGVVVVDTRLPGDWGASQGKIAGAVREDSGDVASWARKYPKGATIVVYCA